MKYMLYTNTQTIHTDKTGISTHRVTGLNTTQNVSRYTAALAIAVLMLCLYISHLVLFQWNKKREKNGDYTAIRLTSNARANKSREIIHFIIQIFTYELTNGNQIKLIFQLIIFAENYFCTTVDTSRGPMCMHIQ